MERAFRIELKSKGWKPPVITIILCPLERVYSIQTTLSNLRVPNIHIACFTASALLVALTIRLPLLFCVTENFFISNPMQMVVRAYEHLRNGRIVHSLNLVVRFPNQHGL